MEDFNAGSFTNWPVGGDIIIRAWFWMGERRYGTGFETTLVECLRNAHPNGLPKKCQKAFEHLSTH
jgi:hypothetical protein